MLHRRSAALLLSLLLLLTTAAAAAAATVTAGPIGSDVAVEASGDGPDTMPTTEAQTVAPGEGGDPAELADEGLISVEAADASAEAEAEAHRQDLATRPKQPKRTVDAIRPEQQLQPQLRPGSTSNGGGGFIANLFRLTRPEESSGCPGVCYHALAALIQCEKVLDDKPCPQASMRCCVSAEDAPEQPQSYQEQLQQEIEQMQQEQEQEIYPTTEEAVQTTTSEQPTTVEKVMTPVTAPPPESATESSPAVTREQTDIFSDKMDTEDTIEGLPRPQPYSESSGTTICPGVCVARRIADYCDAALDLPDVCVTDQRCCVPKDLFDGVDEVPEQFVILGKTKPDSGESEPEQAAEEEEETTSASNSVKIPEKKKCAGQCVTGLFSYLCDRVDSTVKCSNGGRCCVSRSSSSNKKPEATTTPKPEPEGEKCPGICMPGFMAAYCKAPAFLMSDNKGCSGSQVCCNNQGDINKEDGPKPTEPSRPSGGGGGGFPIGALLNQALGAAAGGGGGGGGGGGLIGQLAPLAASLLSGAGGGGGGGGGGLAAVLPALLGAGGGGKRPNRPQVPKPDRVDVNNRPNRPQLSRPPPPPEPVDPRPVCPDTCIGPFLSFTCFSSAEMTDLFKCPSKKERCCAKKSNIRRLQQQQQQYYNTGSVDYPDYTPQQYPGEPYPPQYPHGEYPPQPEYQPEYTEQYPPQEYQPEYQQAPPPQPEYEQGPEFIGGQPGLPSRIDGGPGHIQIFQTTPAPPPPPPRPDHTNKYVCGVKGPPARSGRVVGGTDAAPGEWCWHVALINSQNQYLCGGALIGTQWVLTAAHCVTNIVRSGDAIYVRVGDHDLTSKFGSLGAQTLRVSTTYIHHNHNSQTLDNDIALLKLHGQVDLKEGVCLVCLPARGVEQPAGSRCTVSGYGYQGETGPIPLRVRAAELPIVSDNECVRKINAVTEKIFILPASSFCAGGEEGHDACQGDGGGPLVCNVDGYYELSGMVSWGFGCGRQDVPGVYVKVSSFIGWINQIISVNNL